MARSRNIKPAFFNNDELAELDPIDRLAFIGLWTIADFKGCLECRPKRIKAQILPYDNCDINDILINLDKSGFIAIYSVLGQLLIKVVNFSTHQNPHKNEKLKGSDIPDISLNDVQVIDFNGITINRDINGTDPADSFNLIPETFNPITSYSAAMPCKDGEFNIPDDLYKTWQEAYPLINMGDEINKAKSWLLSNPKNLKTVKGMPRFLNGWLSRAKPPDKCAKTSEMDFVELHSDKTWADSL